MLKKLAVRLLVAGGVALAQATSPAPSVKSTPASETLMRTAKELAAEKVNFQNVLNQARSTADASSKQLMDQFQAKSKDLQDKIRVDKKYGPMLIEVEAIQKQLNSLQQDQQDKFQKATGPIQQKIASDNVLIQGLVPIVKKESGFDDAATFDIDTQTWKNASTSKKEGK